MRRWRYWLGGLLGVLLLGCGVLVAVLGYAQTSGPDGAVRGYFAALARSDAAAALAFGDVPDGPHTLLTATVLRDQQRIAPLRHFAVTATHRHGSRASVRVRYTLAFPGHDEPITVDVPVHRSSGDWRLDRVAIATEFDPIGALQRESIVGAGIPAGRTLLFPGALPIRFDTPYLQLDPQRDTVSFDTASTADVFVELTPAGRAAMLAALRTKLERCLSGPADPACPLPGERYVPGSVRGSIKSGPRPAAIEVDTTDPVGRLDFDDLVTVTGSYRKLTFHNVQVAGHGEIDLHVRAVAYAVAPLTVTWTAA